MKKAIIVGCQGQDGRLLSGYLLKRKYQVIGLDQDSIEGLGIEEISPVNIKNQDDVSRLIQELKPDEVYYLAAFHHSSQSRQEQSDDLFRLSFEVHVLGLVNFLEAIRQYSPQTRLFYAASSHIFGDPKQRVQDETTAVNPGCCYGITKAAGVFLCRLYRKEHGIFACVGILYNHESALRQPEFISKKIITGAVNIKNGKQEKLLIGDLGAQIDWGYAPDYVEAMHRIMNCKIPDDFIVATGVKHSVLDFIKTAFGCLNLDWKKYVVQDKSIITKKNFCRMGDARKLRKITGWKPSVDFIEMVKLLVEAEVSLHG